MGPLAGVRQITFRYRIDSTRGARFVPVESPDQTATVSLYFQQRGDTWTARGRYASYRWYVPGWAVIPIIPGEHSVTVRLDDTWTNVMNVPKSQDPQGYAVALKNAAVLGVAFGTAGARSYGVNTTGSARFTLLALDIS